MRVKSGIHLLNIEVVVQRLAHITIVAVVRIGRVHVDEFLSGWYFFVSQNNHSVD